MIRRAAAVAIVLCLSPSWLCAQSTDLTIKAAVANIRKSPSTNSAVIGKAPRGTVLSVTRESGRWVKVSWPAAQDGAGYVHVSVGLLTRRSATTPERLARIRSRLLSAPTNVAQPVAAPSMPLTQPTHIVGLGSRIGGSTFGFGGTARRWTRDRLGIQFDVSRFVLTGSGPERLTSIQFAPSLLYSLPDRMSDHLWLRPYVGAGANLYHSTLHGETLGLGDSASDNGLGLQTFGGGELTFASAPRFALSADIGYRWARTPFAGFELGGLALSVSGHWYVR
jgi:hypothetical protein